MKVGHRVTVVAPTSMFKGEVGIVREIKRSAYPYSVCVTFRTEEVGLWFMKRELKKVVYG